MVRMKIALILSMLLSGCVWPVTREDFPSIVNFGHLDHLTEKISFRGDSVDIVHIYSNYPDYAWVGAAESGPEGIACVDDAARAAVVSLRHYELTKDSESLARARGLLAFVAAMQTDDGDFYNFIFDDHTINETGVTSQKSFGWWAARGVWAMATGCKVLAPVDPAMSRQLADKVRRSLPRVDSALSKYDQSGIMLGFRVPHWLPYGSGADVSSELMLGLAEYVSATHDKAAQVYLKKLADGLMTMQDGDEASYPFGLHRSWETMWHMWGNGQTQALAVTGHLLQDLGMVKSAEREARGFYSRLLINGFFKEMDVADSTSRVRFEQIAYGVRPMAVGLIRLYEVTGKEEYLVMAGLAASWLLSNNVAGAAIYDPATGRCFDGIRDSTTINKNSGAESTIEALGTLLEVEHYDLSRRFLHARKVRTVSTKDALAALFEVPGGEEAVVGVEPGSKSLVVLRGKEAGEYFQKLSESAEDQLSKVKTTKGR
jgi:hypothetical protein